MKKLILVMLLLIPFVALASEPELGLIQGWIVTGLAKFPVFFWLFTFLATAVPVVSILHGAAKSIVRFTTWTDADDKLLVKIEKFVRETPALSVLYKLGVMLKRFSLFKNVK